MPSGRRRNALQAAAEAMFAAGFGGRVLPFGGEAAHAYARIAGERRRAGGPISHFDAQIAAIAVPRQPPRRLAELKKLIRAVVEFGSCRSTTDEYGRVTRPGKSRPAPDLNRYDKEIPHALHDHRQGHPGLRGRRHAGGGVAFQHAEVPRGTGEGRGAGRCVRAQPSSKGWRVKYSGDKRTFVDGPFAETKELVAGYTIIQVKSREEAIEWTRRFPNPAVDGKSGEIEVREFFELEDSGPSEAVERFRELGIGART